jgi:tRNA threonylcarbamoyladenosine biosynthesis protein TsaE
MNLKIRDRRCRKAEAVTMVSGRTPHTSQVATDLRFLSHSYEETLALGVRFAKVLKKGDIVCLFGDLGSGKTALVKGLARGLKIDADHVHSPTFTLMNIYHGKLPLYHFDLYRIGVQDLLNIGYDEFFFGKGVTAVEWSERLDVLAPKECWKVELRHAGEDQREILVSACGKDPGERLKKAKERLGMRREV